MARNPDFVLADGARDNYNYSPNSGNRWVYIGTADDMRLKHMNACIRKVGKIELPNIPLSLIQPYDTLVPIPAAHDAVFPLASELGAKFGYSPNTVIESAANMIVPVDKNAWVARQKQLYGPKGWAERTYSAYLAKIQAVRDWTPS